MRASAAAGTLAAGRSAGGIRPLRDTGRLSTLLWGCSRHGLTSGGTTIRVELCRAGSAGRAVVVLHGCGGFSMFDHRLVTELPHLGISTLDVDYVAPTPSGTQGFCNARSRALDEFPRWVEVARDAGRALRLDGGVDGRHSLAETLPLFRALRAAHVVSSLYVYLRGSHDWPGRQGTLGIRHAAAFLRAHLRSGH